MSDERERWVIGDVQGYLDALLRVLNSVGLISGEGAHSWTGGRSSLAVLGDLVDRGPDGVGVIELLMRLEKEARRVGGRVEVVIGNHDILMLAACRFGSMMSNATGRTVMEDWRLSGGVASDLARLTDAHVMWLRDLPGMRLEREVLMVHADALLYCEYGSSVEEVNAAFAAILHGDDFAAWDRLLDNFSQHRAFLGPSGCQRLEELLAMFGGQQLVHGHTPIARMTRRPPEAVTVPYEYCDGRCINVDPGLYLGGPGFAYKLKT